MRIVVGWFALWAVLSSGTAEAFCEGHNFAAKQAALTLSQLNSALINKDIEKIKRESAMLEANLPCMRTPAPPQVFATAYRYIGLGHYYRGDSLMAERWFRTALELNPAHRWGVSEISSADEVYALYEAQREVAKTELVPIEGMQIETPEGTQLYIDGRPWNVAAVTPDRPHIVFVASATDRHVISRHLIDGNALPEILLVKADPVETKKKRKPKKAEEDVSEIDSMFAVQKVKRVRPKAKTPLLVSGVATMAVAGGIYGYTFVTNDSFYSANTTQDKDAIRRKNNSLVVVSAVVVGLGLGIEYAGIMLNGGPSTTHIPWQL